MPPSRSLLRTFIQTIIMARAAAKIIMMIIIMMKMTRAAVKVCNQDFSDLRRDTRSSRRVFLTIWKGEKVGCHGMVSNNKSVTKIRFHLSQSSIYSFIHTLMYRYEEQAGRKERVGSRSLLLSVI